MVVQLTIVGLGQIGASVGLALAKRSDLLRRVGHDRDPKVARQAEKIGAVDRVDYNLPMAVRQADLVLLSLPFDQIQETLGIIAQDLKDNVVIMDTAPVKECVATWVRELMPAKRHYVGLTPAINPAYLHQTEVGQGAAREDLFHSGLMVIAAPQGTDSAAIKLAADFVTLLGAKPLFADLAEVDGLMAAVHSLPQLMAAALLAATINQPGWREGRKIAGKSYAQATAPILYTDAPRSLQETLLKNPKNVLRVLGDAILALEDIRQAIAQDDGKGLEDCLNHAQSGRDGWWKERQAGNWAGDGMPTVEVPELPGFFGRLMGSGWKKVRGKDES